MQAIADEMYLLLHDEHPMTVRQVFYRMTTAGMIAKTEAEYKGTVCRLLADMRRAGNLPYTWIADGTRWMRKPSSSSSLSNYLEDAARFYRRAVWDEQDAYVEVWLEKEALAGVLYKETQRWDVPLMVTRGYPSLSFLYSAAEQMAETEKPTYLYYFGDHDPSGIDISRKVEADLHEMAPEADITFKRVAVTPEQIESMSLPTRPTKSSDTRSRNFMGDSVEVDAIPSTTLREIAYDCIALHINRQQYNVTKAAEESEREILEEIAATAAGAA